MCITILLCISPTIQSNSTISCLDNNRRSSILIGMLMGQYLFATHSVVFKSDYSYRVLDV